MTSDIEDEVSDCASPPCFMHEVDPAYMGFDAATDAEQRERESRAKKPPAVACQTRPPESDRIAKHRLDAAEDISGRDVPG
jgi:hypothetical protein